MTTKEAAKTVCLFEVARDELLHVLKQVSGVVEQSQVMQILSHVLLSGQGTTLSIIATNSEVEVETRAKLFSPAPQNFAITVSCKTLMDICRALPEGALLSLHQQKQWVVVKAGQSQFRLSTLPEESFPRLPQIKPMAQVQMVEADLKASIEKTCFSMAYQDARFFLNGMLIEVEGEKVNAVATDGHRLSWNVFKPTRIEAKTGLQVILPRKTVIELMRLLRHADNDVDLVIGSQSVEVVAPGFKLRSNLIDGSYPNYRKLIPDNASDLASVDVDALKRALGCVAILANEKFKGAKFRYENNELIIVSSNFDQEEATESLPIEYAGKPRSVAFNIGYVLDVLNVIQSSTVGFQFSETANGVLIEDDSSLSGSYVIMPLTL